ncbi:MAG: adenylate/guanylate cyclase domain-containing protein [bacterium]
MGLGSIVRSKDKYWQLLSRFDALCDSNLDLDSLIGRATEELLDVLNVESVYLYLVDDRSYEYPLYLGGKRGKTEGWDENHILSLAQKSMNKRRILRGKGSKGSPLRSICIAPMVMALKPVGAIACLNKIDGDFTDEDIKVLIIAESQLDNAIEHAKIYESLTIRNKELSIISKIDRIRRGSRTFEEALYHIIRELTDAFNCEAGFVMLRKGESGDLEIKGIDPHSKSIFSQEEYGHLKSLAAKAIDRRSSMTFAGDEISDPLVNSLICCPLMVDGGLLGVLGLGNKKAETGFDMRDIRLLDSLSNNIASVVFECRGKAVMRGRFEGRVVPRTLQQLLENPDRIPLLGERRRVTLLFADVKGYTSTAESMKPTEAVGHLSEYLKVMADIVLKHQGMLDKFIDDAVVAIFGAPLPCDDHALRACKVALEMQRAVGELNKRWAISGKPQLDIGIGIHTGEVILGNIGGERYGLYTAIGRGVDLVAELEDISRGRQIILDEYTYGDVEGQIIVKAMEPVGLKGAPNPIRIYDLRGINERAQGTL